MSQRPKTERAIIRDMFVYIVDRANRIEQAMQIIDQTTVFKDGYRTQARGRIMTDFEQLVKMVMTLKNRRNIPNQTPFTSQELKDLFVTEDKP